jgi:hypothetical protein
MQEIAGYDSDDDFSEGYGDPRTNGNEAREQRQADPEGSDQVVIILDWRKGQREVCDRRAMTCERHGTFIGDV